MNQEDNRRCGWCKSDPVYIKYHDEEWGKEVTEDHKMFEFLVLESVHLQAVGYVNDHLDECPLKYRD